MAITLTAQPLTAKAFAPFGDVIECRAEANVAMNQGAFERFDALAEIEHDAESQAAIGLVRAVVAQHLPYRVPLMERHPLGTQAFIPRSEFAFVIVVAAPGEAPSARHLKAFVTNGRQGINYHRGTWHMPLVALAAGQEFVVVDRAGGSGNLDEVLLTEDVQLTAQFPANSPIK